MAGLEGGELVGGEADFLDLGFDGFQLGNQALTLAGEIGKSCLPAQR
jgi:hypothetical protein